jgi:CubicO group peptidase (beta-lactamase class C family)
LCREAILSFREYNGKPRVPQNWAGRTRELMPEREAHPPGAFWYYNNWDFNVLGGVYERKLNRKIGEAFQREIAAPIQMQDFRIDDMYYLKSEDSAPAFARSRYPAYHFRLTARDMARFGYLFLRGGNWNGTQVIPADRVRESTTSYSQTTGFGEGFGYGYLWWVHGYGLNVDVFSARGRFGQIHRCDSGAGLGGGVCQSHGISRRPSSRIDRRGESAAGCSRFCNERAPEPVVSRATSVGIIASHG